jgi:hypothetical protein
MNEVVPFPTPEPEDGLAVRQTMEIANERMLAPAGAAGYELPLVGATPPLHQRSIHRTPQGVWLFDDYVNDPTALEYKGEIPVPQGETERLVALWEAGVRAQYVWIGHQLPDDYQEGQPLPRLVPAPRELREKDEKLKLNLTKAAKVLGVVAAGTLALAVSPLALAAAGVGQDPIVLGGVRHPKAPVVAWCVLCQWEWE